MAGTMRSRENARPASVNEATLFLRLPSSKESSMRPLASSDLTAELSVCLLSEKASAMPRREAEPEETSISYMTQYAHSESPQLRAKPL